MKNFKKIFAIVLAMAMVLGMSVTVFATTNDLGDEPEPEQTEHQWAATGNTDTGIIIPVSGVASDSKTEYYVVPLIQPNQNGADTGWEFVCSNEQKAIFLEKLGTQNEQEAIKKLIQAGTDSNDVVSIIASVANNVSIDETMLADTIHVNKAGMYYIYAVDQNRKYVYSPMAAYVSFGSFVSGPVYNLVTDGVTAKYSEIPVTKSNDDTDKVTEINQVVTYYIESVVPYLPVGNTNRDYVANDTITGAEYEKNSEGKVELSIWFDKTLDQVKEKVEKKDTPDATGTGTISSVQGGQSFTANLTDAVLKDGNGEAINDHANKSIIISYQAKVTGTQVNNNVTIKDAINNGNTIGSSDDQLYTASLTINKVDAANTNTKLSGAEFIISRGTNDEVEYAQFDTSGKLIGWTNDETKAGKVTTVASSGSVTVTGLNVGTYHITETVAPKGYSINNNIPDVTIALGENETVASATVIKSEQVEDTTLSALPSTGGIGTTIFTIGGCAIIIIAAGLFFASRRKAAK